MPLYTVDTVENENERETYAVELEDSSAARSLAARFGGELLKNDFAGNQDAHRRIEVRNNAGTLIFVVSTSTETSSVAHLTTT